MGLFGGVSEKEFNTMTKLAVLIELCMLYQI